MRFRVSLAFVTIAPSTLSVDKTRKSDVLVDQGRLKPHLQGLSVVDQAPLNLVIK